MLSFKRNHCLQCHHQYWRIGFISPHQSDFVTYASSKRKIKDHFSSNQVAGEGLIRWSFHDANGIVVTIELMGYHIPTTDVRLLSLQLLIRTLGGHAFLNNQGWTSA